MDFEKQAATFRAQVADLGPRSRTTAYPIALRTPALRFVRARLAGGSSLTAAAAELGLGVDTVRRWQAGGRGRRLRRARVRPVVIVSAPPTAPALVVHGPAGLRVEGLDVVALAELLRRLS